MNRREIERILRKKSPKLAEKVEKYCTFDKNRVYFRTKTLDFVFLVYTKQGRVVIDIEEHKVLGVSLGSFRKIVRKQVMKGLGFLTELFPEGVSIYEHKANPTIALKNMRAYHVSIRKGDIDILIFIE